MKIGFSLMASALSDALLDELFKAGIETLEICSTPIKEEELSPAETVARIEAHGLTLSSYHFPYIPFDPWDISAPELAPACIAYFEGVIRRWSAVGVKYFIIHPSGEPISDEERPMRLKTAKQSLLALVPVARECGAILCVEDLPRTNLGNCASELIEMADLDDSIGICMDTNHFQGADVCECIRRLGKRIVRTHISDCDSINERHWLPGEGELNWQEIYRAFCDIGYNGVWLYECGLQTPVTILRERDLLPEDIVKNAREIFAGKKPTPFGKPKPGIGMWE